MRRRTAALPWLTAALLAAVALLVPSAGAQDPSAPAPLAAPPPYFGQGQSWDAGEPGRKVAIFGDSFVRQSSSVLGKLAESRSTALDVWAWSGAAPCDLLPSYASRMQGAGLSRVEFAFVGNATTHCMTSRLGGRPVGRLTPAVQSRIAELYAADLSSLVAVNRAVGAVTYLVLPPTMARATWHGQLTASLTAAYRGIAAADPQWVRLNTAAVEQLTPGGAYRSLQRVNGRVVRLRHTDGTHLAAPLGTTAYAQALLWPLVLEP